MLQRVAACGRVLQRVAVCCSGEDPFEGLSFRVLQRVAESCSEMQ